MSKITRGEFLNRSAALAAALGTGTLAGCADALDRGQPTGSAGARPDLGVVNGRVFTVDDRLPQAEAFAVKDGRFIAVGTSSDIRNLVGPGTRVIDAEGMTVTPGFIDAHTHPASGGIREMKLVHLDLPTNAQVLDALRRRASETAPGQWVIGFKYEETKVREGRPVTVRELDEAVPNHPVRINTRSGHVGWYNSRAFALGGITKDTPAPDRGRYYKDADGELNGMVAGPAANALNRHIPDTHTRAERQAGVKLASEMMTASGLTSVHDAGAGVEDLIAYRDCLDAGEMRFRVWSMFRQQAYEGLKAAGIRTGFGDDWFRLGAVKHSSDGAASNRTMLMSEPYVGRPDDFGLEYLTQEEIDEAVEDAYAHGFRIGIHANGDVAITRVLNAYERAVQRYPESRARPRIEHCSLVTPEILRRIRDVGAIPTPFHTYIYWHGNMFHEYGAERMERMFAHRSFLDAGIPVAPASDYVPGPFEPMMAMQSMVTRKDFQGREWGPSQKVTVDEALRILTINGAHAAFEEEVKGSITEGKLADFVILGADPHEVDPDRIVDIPIARTVVGGATMYEG
jgi:predicted amidohydrolase YtcJ